MIPKVDLFSFLFWRKSKALKNLTFRVHPDIMPSTGVWTLEIPQNLNCPESRLFLAQFNPTKKDYWSKERTHASWEIHVALYFQGRRNQWALPRARQDIMPSTGVWTFEIPQNPNCPEFRLFLAKFNPTKNGYSRKTSCKLGKRCCPVISGALGSLGPT